MEGVSTVADSLWDRITSDLKIAMKAQDKLTTSVLRMMLSELKYAKANLNAEDALPEKDAVKVVTIYHKRLVKSLDDYPEGEKRAALDSEIAVVVKYLPAKASEAEVTAVVESVLGATEERNFGLLMKDVMAQLGDTADGKMVSKVLKSKLA